MRFLLGKCGKKCKDDRLVVAAAPSLRPSAEQRRLSARVFQHDELDNEDAEEVVVAEIFWC
jgi:hypothetical protein